MSEDIREMPQADELREISIKMRNWNSYQNRIYFLWPFSQSLSDLPAFTHR